MSTAAQTAPEPPPLGSTRISSEEMAQTHPPANAFERMLLEQVAQSWERLQRAYEVERAYAKGRDLAEVIRTKLEEFKAVTRYVTDCERAWRHAVLNLEKAQRRRQRETKAAPETRRSAANRTLDAPPPGEVPQPSEPLFATVRPALRE